MVDNGWELETYCRVWSNLETFQTMVGGDSDVALTQRRGHLQCRVKNADEHQCFFSGVGPWHPEQPTRVTHPIVGGENFVRRQRPKAIIYYDLRRFTWWRGQLLFPLKKQPSVCQVWTARGWTQEKNYLAWLAASRGFPTTEINWLKQFLLGNFCCHIISGEKSQCFSLYDLKLKPNSPTAFTVVINVHMCLNMETHCLSLLIWSSMYEHSCQNGTGTCRVVLCLHIKDSSCVFMNVEIFRWHRKLVIFVCVSHPFSQPHFFRYSLKYTPQEISDKCLHTTSKKFWLENKRCFTKKFKTPRSLNGYKDGLN